MFSKNWLFEFGDRSIVKSYLPQQRKDSQRWSSHGHHEKISKALGGRNEGDEKIDVI